MLPIREIIKWLKQRVQRNLLDEEFRRQKVDAAINKYLQKWRELEARGRELQGEKIYEPLNKLATLFEEHELDSLALFKLAWKRNPADKVLLSKVAKELLTRGETTKEAVSIYRAAEEVEPNKFPFLAFIANYYRSNNLNYDLMLVNDRIIDTFEEYEAIVRKGSDEEKLKLAEVDWVKAGRLYEQAKQESINLYLTLGRRDKRAIALFKEALRNDPENIEVLEILIGMLLKERCVDEEAVEIYEHYLAYKPDASEVIGLLSKGYFQQHRDQEALALLEGHFRLHPEEHQCLESIISYYMSKPELPENALEFFKVYLKLHLHNEAVLKRIAEFYAKQQRCDDEIIEYYRRYIPFAPEPHKFLFLLGRYYSQRQRWPDAIEVFEQLYNDGERSREVILPLASCYAFCERRDAQAIPLYEEAFRLGTGNLRIKEMLSEFYSATNQLTELAQRCFLETLRENPQHIYSRIGLSKFYLEKGAYLEAAKALTIVLTQEPENKTAQQLLSKCIVLSAEDDLLLDSLDVLSEQIRKQIYALAFQQNPALKKITLWLADNFLQKQRDDNLALQVYKAAQELSPANLQLLNILSLTCTKHGELEEALNIDKQIFSVCYQICIHNENLPAQKRAICTEACVRLARAFIEGRFLGKKEEMDSILSFAYQCGFAPEGAILYLADSIISNKQDSDKDLELLEKALSYDPKRQDIFEYLVKAYIAHNRPELVVNHCRNLLELNPFDSRTLNWLIDCLSKYPIQDTKLETLLENAYCQNPTHQELTIALALIYGRMRHYDPITVRILERAAQLRPDDLQLQLFLARGYEESGNLQKAIFIFQRIRWAIPDDQKIIQELANAYMKADAKEVGVLNVVEQALKFNPDDAELNLFKLRLLFSSGKTDIALGFLDEIRQRLPEKIDSIIETLERRVSAQAETPSPEIAKLASLLVERGKLDAAIKYLEILTTEYQQYLSELLDCYTRILQQDPRHIFARMERAILYRLIDEYELSAQDLESIMDYAESSPNILHELAETYELWAKKEKEPSRQLNIFYNLGRLYFRLGEFDPCIAIYQNILRLDKLSEEALLYLARCYYRKQAPELALQYCKRLEKTEEVKALLYELGDTFYAQHNLTSAHEAFNEIVNADIGFRDVALKLTEVQKELQGTLLPEKERQSLIGELSDRARQRFDLREEIGRGAWSVVIKAYDRELDELVALKILPARFSEDEAAVELFKNEAKLTRRLSHPGIVRIYDVGEEAGRKYISMEYIAGKSLRAILNECKYIPPLEMIPVSLQIADALDYAHSQGVLHGDIKPANILITSDNQVKVTDFGIAAVVAQSEKITAGLFAGTPLYMSPEQVEGLPCTPVSDLYSFGVVMYEMLSGSPPFKVGNIAYHHLFTKPPALKNIPEPLADIVFKCLEKKPEARYQSAIEIINDLKKARELLQGEIS